MDNIKDIDIDIDELEAMLDDGDDLGDELALDLDKVEDEKSIEELESMLDDEDNIGDEKSIDELESMLDDDAELIMDDGIDLNAVVDFGDEDTDKSLNDIDLNEVIDFGDGEDTDIDLSSDVDFGAGSDANGENEGLNVEDIKENRGSMVIGSDGNIVVQDNTHGESFKLEYIDINNIAVSQRVRKSRNVDSLVQSIKSTGLLSPIVVAPLTTEGLYVLIHGYRRIIACAKAGLTRIPCIVNNKINTPDIPIIESMYNHTKAYSMKEMVEYIEYLEKEKGILNASMIEYLLQLDNGDYTKLKDILNDDDEDIVSGLMEGQLTIGQAFKKLEARRKKESKDEKEQKKADKVYGESDSGVEKLAGSGEEGSDDVALSDEEISELAIGSEELNEVEEKDLDEMIEESKKDTGFEPNKQDYKKREILDPALRKSVLVRDDNTCQCCGLSGQEYVDVFDIHHKVEVYLGGSDDIDNLITTCTICHKLIHLYARGELYIRPASELSEEEQKKFKKIIALGNIIRKGMEKKNMKRDELKKVDKAETIGRTKPGTPNQVAT